MIVIGILVWLVLIPLIVREVRKQPRQVKIDLREVQRGHHRRKRSGVNSDVDYQYDRLTEEELEELDRDFS